MNNSTSEQNSVQIYGFITNLRNGIWLLGIPSWLFGISDRSMATLADGYLSAMDFMQLFTASLFFLSWLLLKPDRVEINTYPTDSNLIPYEFHTGSAPNRILELRKFHLISQEYLLPFSHLCQIYHLLNLKHLETVHSFSLSNLKVISVTHFQPTAIGGIIKFQTMLDSAFNALRIWRQPVVEVILALHNPHTVELNIPVYGNKRIVVMFNVEPISEKEHKLFIDIYSNLDWPKPLLQLLLHLASCLTLFEDLPYLRKLAERNIDRLFNTTIVPSHETAWLFRRFIELYGATQKSSESIKMLASKDPVTELA
ncbi:hypothetical protein NIES2119_02470 [[Phormidium ambiguum] IAM M-71]|uniref:Uncharacterized protein n=1 Tax=[Phormidium ambiguum] IAM M-71 TaxID=454136 RepID=A0A1U7ISR7_9CYAN|nr:hypothetical protein [Phormidium ambiguum]OKH40499.1 hypothetical protein NIES2119_02470 [Phormidium ambiguum IAM M-71]